MKTIAVDLDGVILDYNGWQGVDHFGNPKPNAILTLKQLRNLGCKIIIHTTRINPVLQKGFTLYELERKVKECLGWFNIPYDEVWCGIGKPLADIYLDDRALRFTDWQTIVKQISENETQT